MGKKGVLLDNGKSAQSSMALYWKKNKQQSKGPKKQYQPTEQQQLDQRVQSGFQKWKLHKEKMIAKANDKKQKTVQTKNETKKNNEEEQDELQFLQKQQKLKGPIHIPGFKNKSTLKQKLRPESTKAVDQSDNVLKLPSHMSDITQEDILRILRQKKAKSDHIKRKKEMEQQDVMLGQDFLQSFKKKPKDEQVKPEEEKIEPQVQTKKEQLFFKSQILNQISKGNFQSIAPKKQQLKPTQIIQPQVQKQEPNLIIQQKKVPQFKPSFVPRSLLHKN